MDMNALREGMRGRLLGAALTAAVVSGCSLQNQDTPGLSGPSGLSLSMSMSVTPDHLVQDGESQAIATVTVRDAQGAPVSGLGITWSVSASDGSPVEVSTQSSVTNAQGQATTRVTAPEAPQQIPASAVKLRISAQAQGNDASTLAPGWDRNKMNVEVELVPPAGTPLPNKIPVASFSIVPATGNIAQTITFDASPTMDEGMFCLDRCTYLWDFGDFTSDSGRTVSHVFMLPKTYRITLTVTDPRGAVHSSTQNLAINGPAEPVAQFTVLPATPAAGVAAVLDGSGSSVGAGATISQYSWNFGDGTTANTPGPATTHTWSAASTYPVVLTVTDSLGRTATQTLVITVH
jgi:PKD repeat protein